VSRISQFITMRPSSARPLLDDQIQPHPSDTFLRFKEKGKCDNNELWPFLNTSLSHNSPLLVILFCMQRLGKAREIFLLISTKSLSAGCTKLRYYCRWMFIRTSDELREQVRQEQGKNGKDDNHKKQKEIWPLPYKIKQPVNAQPISGQAKRDKPRKLKNNGINTLHPMSISEPPSQFPRVERNENVPEFSGCKIFATTR